MFGKLSNWIWFNIFKCKHIILKFHIKPILEMKHAIYLFMHNNLLLCMMDDYEHLKTNVIVFLMVEWL
jgi:hypothetical protein